jgi:hypothetical protein
MILVGWGLKSNPYLRGMEKPLFLPLQCSTLEFVNESYNENESEKEHWAEHRDSGKGKFTVGKYPRNQKNNIDVKKDKQHRSYIKFDRVPGGSSNFG